MKIFPTENDIRKKLLIAEIIVMICGIALSVYGIVKVCTYDMSYLGYCVFPLLGVGIIAGIIVSLIKKYRYAHIIIAVIIAVWGIFAGFAYLVCQAQSVRLRNEMYAQTQHIEETQESTADGKG